MPIDAGDAVWRIRGDTSELDQALADGAANVERTSGDVMGSLSTVGKGMTVIGAGIVGAMGGLVTGWANAGDEVQKMSLRTGVSTETLSEFRHAAELSGTTLGGLETGIRRMQRAVVDAGDGTATYVDALGRVGLTYEDLAGLSVEEQFLKIAYAMADVDDATTRAAVAQEIFGRAGTQLLPMLAGGAEGLAAMRAEAHELGIVYDQEGANAAAHFNDEMLRVKESLQGVMIQLGPTIATMIEDFVPGIIETAKSIAGWIQENQELVKTITVVAAGAGALMVTLGPLLVMLPGIAALVKAVIVVGGALAGVLSGPVVLAIAAVVAAGVALYASWDHIKAAGAAVWQVLQVAFETGGAAVAAVWGWMVDTGRAAWESLASGFAWLGDAITAIFTGVADFFRGIWNGIISIFQGAWEIIRTIVNAVIGGVNSVMAAASKLPGVPNLQLPMLAEGGPAQKGQPYFVGERGRELFIPSETGRVENASNTGGGGVVLNVNINGPVNANSEQDVRRLSESIADVTVRELRAVGMTA